MGNQLGCGQKEVNLRCFTEQEYRKLEQYFIKYSKLKDGSSGSYIGYKGFQQIFPTIKQFARKLHTWISKRNIKNHELNLKYYIDIAEIFLNENTNGWETRNQDLAQYSKSEVFGIICTENQIQGKEYDREYVDRVSISYSEGLFIIKQLTQMLLDNEDVENQQIVNDDISSKIAADGIFQGSESLEFYVFFRKMGLQFSNLDQCLKSYFAKCLFGRQQDGINNPKQIHSQYSSEQEGEPQSLILRKSMSALLSLGSNTYAQYPYMRPLFEYIKYEQSFNFTDFQQTLLNYTEGPTLILIRHIEEFQEIDEYALAKSINPERVGKNHYVVGILNKNPYKEYPQVSGDSDTTIFSIIPRFKVLKANNSAEASGRQYANLSSINQSNNVKAGLSFGGDPKKNARLFISENIQDSYINNVIEPSTYINPTFENTCVFPSEVSKLNIDIIEVWGLSQSQYQIIQNEETAKHHQKIIHKQHTENPFEKEDIGVMKQQDDGYENELEQVHNIQTTVTHSHVLPPQKQQTSSYVRQTANYTTSKHVTSSTVQQNSSSQRYTSVL